MTVRMGYVPQGSTARTLERGERTKGEENAARPIQTLEQEGVRCVAAKILKTQKDSQGVV